MLLENPWEPGNLGSAWSSAVGVPGTWVPSPSLVSCGRLCSARQGVVDSHQLLESPWQAAGCPLPLAKPCASQQPSCYLIFQICVNNPLNFSIPLFSQILCGRHGSWLSPGVTHSDFRPEEKLACWALVCFIFVTLLVSLIKCIPLCPQTLLLYVLRSLYPVSASTTTAKTE